MAFSFNFGGDDIDESMDQDVDVPAIDNSAVGGNAAQSEQAPPVVQHDLRQLVGLDLVFLVLSTHACVLFLLSLFFRFEVALTGMVIFLFESRPQNDLSQLFFLIL